MPRDIITDVPRSYSLLADVMKRVLPSETRDRIYGIELVQKRWKDAVGADLARRSEPDSLNDGVLTLRVADAAWGRMLMKLGKTIVPRLNRELGVWLVRRINFKTVTRLEQADALPPPALSGARDVVLPEAISKAAEAIHDAELRAIVGRTAARYLAVRRDEEKRRT